MSTLFSDQPSDPADGPTIGMPEEVRRSGLEARLENEPRARSVSIANGVLWVWLRDGRIFGVPIDWYPRLAFSPPEALKQYRIVGQGTGIHWPAPDEDVEVRALLEGRRSAEGPASLERWIETRGKLLREEFPPRPMGITHPRQLLGELWRQIRGPRRGT